jgi:YD repeat-containing protein
LRPLSFLFSSLRSNEQINPTRPPLSDPLARRNTSTYDAAGRLRAQIDPLANRTTLNYDNAGGSPRQRAGALGAAVKVKRHAAGQVSPFGRA